MVQVKWVIAVLTTIFLIVNVHSVHAQKEATPEVDKVKLRVLEMKKKKLIELLDLKPEQVAKFIPEYEAGQQRIDEAKHYLDGAVKKLQKILKDGSDPEIASVTDELLRTYDNLVATQRERVTSLKPLLSVEQYAKLLMFEIRFPEVLQKLIMKRGIFHPDNRKPED